LEEYLRSDYWSVGVKEKKMSRYEDTNEFRIQKQGMKGYPATYIAERKVLVWDGWNPFSKKPSGYFWTTVINNKGKGIGNPSFDIVKMELDKYISDQHIFEDCNETVLQLSPCHLK
jgi:hypothetical protein